jgi:RHS repeat-associated protein
VWLGDEPVAVFMPNGTNPPNVFYIHNDHLGAPRAIVNTAGQLRWRWLAEPFGTTAPETNPAALGAFTFNLRMPGQYADSETGLFYNYFRDYDAGTGRYVQSDPIGLAGGINTYSYVESDPTGSADPDGLRGRRNPPPIPGDYGRYPHVPDYWRNDPGQDYREGHYASVCVRSSCPFINPPNLCSVSNSDGSAASRRQGPFLSAPGAPGLCICEEWRLEWRLGRRPPNGNLDRINLILDQLGGGY